MAAGVRRDRGVGDRLGRRGRRNFRTRGSRRSPSGSDGRSAVSRSSSSMPSPVVAGAMRSAASSRPALPRLPRGPVGNSAAFRAADALSLDASRDCGVFGQSLLFEQALFLRSMGVLCDRLAGSGILGTARAEQRRFARRSSIGSRLRVSSCSRSRVTFAAIDFTLSMDPHFKSSIYGMLICCESVLLALSVAVLVRALWRPRGISQINRDLGRFLFALLVLWAYLDFMQMLIIWNSDLPEEAAWYLTRLKGEWLSGCRGDRRLSFSAAVLRLDLAAGSEILRDDGRGGSALGAHRGGAGLVDRDPGRRARPCLGGSRGDGGGAGTGGGHCLAGFPSSGFSSRAPVHA